MGLAPYRPDRHSELRRAPGEANPCGRDSQMAQWMGPSHRGREVSLCLLPGTWFNGIPARSAEPGVRVGITLLGIAYLAVLSGLVIAPSEALAHDSGSPGACPCWLGCGPMCPLIDRSYCQRPAGTSVLEEKAHRGRCLRRRNRICPQHGRDHPDGMGRPFGFHQARLQAPPTGGAMHSC